MSDTTTDFATLIQSHNEDEIIRFLEKLSTTEERQTLLNDRFVDNDGNFLYPLQYAAKHKLRRVVKHIVDTIEPPQDLVDTIIKDMTDLQIFDILKTRADPKKALSRILTLGDEGRIMNQLETIGLDKMDLYEKIDVLVTALKKGLNKVSSVFERDQSFFTAENIKTVIERLNEELTRLLNEAMRDNIERFLTTLELTLFNIAFETGEVEEAIKLLKKHKKSICGQENDEEHILLRAIKKASTDVNYMDIVNYIMKSCNTSKEVKQEALASASTLKSQGLKPVIEALTKRLDLIRRRDHEQEDETIKGGGATGATSSIGLMGAAGSGPIQQSTEEDINDYFFGGSPLVSPLSPESVDNNMPLAIAFLLF